MRPALFPFLFLLTGLLTAQPNQTYYLDADGGSDANDGLSETTAWRTLQKIRNDGTEIGNTYLLKRGATWTERLVTQASGTPLAPVIYGSYGHGPLPIITTVADIANGDWQVPANWTESSPGIWQLPISGAPARLYLDEAEALRKGENLALGTTDNAGATSVWAADDSFLSIVSPANPALTFSSIRGAQPSNTVLVDNTDHIILQDLEIRGGSLAAVLAIGSSHLTVRRCRIGGSSRSGLVLTQGSDFALVEDNDFDSEFTLFYGLGSDRGCADGTLLTDGANDAVVTNNRYRNWAHNGVELLATPGNSGTVSRNDISYNDITAPDIPYSHPFGADGTEGRCQFNRFHHLTVTDCRTTIQVNGDHNRVDHNLIVGLRNSPSQSQPTAYGFTLSVYQDLLVCHDNLYDHNLIADTDEAAFRVRGFGLEDKVFNNRIRNNVAFRTGHNPLPGFYPANVALILFDTETDGLGPNVYQHNLFWNDNGDPAPVYLQDSDTRLTVAQFDASDGDQGNTVVGHRDGDPRFASPGNGNYYPAAGSALIDAALPTGDYTTDYLDQPRVVGAGPDIGPIESLEVGLPVSWVDVGATPRGKGEVEIHWEVGTEDNVADYLLERAGPGTDFREVGRVPASHRSDYSFTETEVTAGRWWYRVRARDYDGSETVSPLATVEVAADRFSLATNGDGTYTVLGAAPGQLEITDMAGRVQRTAEGVTFDPRGLPGGAYLLRFSELNTAIIGQGTLDQGLLRSWLITR